MVGKAKVPHPLSPASLVCHARPHANITTDRLYFQPQCACVGRIEDKKRLEIETRPLAGAFHLKIHYFIENNTKFGARRLIEKIIYSIMAANYQ